MSTFAKSIVKPSLLTVIMSCSLGLFLSGCNSNLESQEHAKEQALEGKLSLVEPNQDIINRLMGDYQLIKTVSSQIPSSNIFDERLQPVNKKEKCLLPFMVGNENEKLYWDGDCKNGQAIGLGRAVRSINGKKNYEFLFQIDEEQPLVLKSYLFINYEKAESEVGSSTIELKDEHLIGQSSTLGYNIHDWQDGSYDLTYRFEDTTNLISYNKVIDLINGGVSYIIAYPNYSHDLYIAKDNVLSNLDRTYRIVEGSNTVGLSFIWQKDGRLLTKDNSTNEETVATVDSTELERYLDNIKNQVNNNLVNNDSSVDLGFAKIEEYRVSKCKKHRGFFKGDEVNGICDYIDNFTTAYEGLVKARDNRAKLLESYRKQQDERLFNLENKIKHLGE